VTPTLLVLAAGRGSRFGGPKQLATVGPAGEVLASYSLYDGFRAGFRHFVVVTAPSLVRELEASLGPVLADCDAELVFAVQEEPTGTAGAVRAGGGAVHDRFAVCNADDWYGPEGFRLVWSALASVRQKNRHFLVTYALTNTLASTSRVSRAACDVRPDGLLTGMEELLDVERSPDGPVGMTLDGTRRAIDPGSPVSTNLWGFQASILDALPEAAPDESETLLPSVVASLLESDVISVETLACDGPFFGVTRPEDLSRARARVSELVASGLYPENLRACS